MKFKNLKIQQWNQFEDINIKFDQRLTILTGTNGCGKTTILRLLAKHCGWDVRPLATPEKSKVTGIWEWLSGKINYLTSDPNENDLAIGNITYSNDNRADLKIPKNVSVQYGVSIQGQISTPCFFIPSHRSIFRYESIPSIPRSENVDRMQAFQRVSAAAINQYSGGNVKPANYHIKEILIGWNMLGHGNPDMDANEKLLENYKGFENVLKIVLPKELGFQSLKIKNYEIILECDSGTFLIDAVSGGISSIIDMAWQIYMYEKEEIDEFTVIIDEVENHLHPTMQRQILNDLIKAFPKVGFIVSTHSPLIVGSVRNSSVYVLRYNENKKIVSQLLDFNEKAKTAAEILDEVLGVSFTMPIWAEEGLRNIVNKYANKNVDGTIFPAMKAELASIGLEKFVPEAIEKVVEAKNAQNSPPSLS